METATIEETTAETTMPAKANNRGGVPGKRLGTIERETMVAALRAQGTPMDAVAKALGISVGSAYHIEQRVKKTQQYPLLSTRRVKNAVKVLDTFMSGKPIGREEEINPETGENKVINPGIFPKCSTIKACADSVLDRAYPKAQEEGSKGNISFTQVNISLASPVLESPAISNAVVDVTPILD